MYLGIEIGGTKLQLGVGRGDGSALVALERRDVVQAQGAQGILKQIEEAGTKLLAQHSLEGIGIGFGGPVAPEHGRVVTSHQIEGWDDFPLVDWCRQRFGLPVLLGNDCDSAALAEARFGAGRGRRIVFFVTVGTGIGGGLVVDGRLFGGGRPAIAEIGHLRPGLQALDAHSTVESLASGPGIEAAARRKIVESGVPDAADLLRRCSNDIERLSAKLVAEAASAGNVLAGQILNDAMAVLGWAIAQVLTIAAPEVVVVGGGVSLMGERLFFEPLGRSAAQYVFPPLAGSYEIVPAALCEEVVVHGALALAAMAAGNE